MSPLPPLGNNKATDSNNDGNIDRTDIMQTDNNNNNSAVFVEIDNHNNVDNIDNIESTANGTYNNIDTNIESSEKNSSKKRGRGRPPGSKNKPKMTVAEPQSSVEHQLLEVESGEDIVSSLAAYARSCGGHTAVGVLQATGFVSRSSPVTNRDPYAVNGNLELLTLTGTILPSNNNFVGLNATMVTSTGQVFGVRVEGPLLAIGPVSILVTTFPASNYCKLPPLNQHHSVSRYIQDPVWNEFANRVNGILPRPGQDLNGGAAPPN